MRRLAAANDNDRSGQIAHTREIWQPRLGRDLSDEDARQMLQSVTGFFSVLAEWRHAELIAAANDRSAPGTADEGEVGHDR
jgi:hypothetical protein